MLCYRPRGVNVFVCTRVVCVCVCVCLNVLCTTVGCFSHFIFSTKLSLSIENNSSHFVIQSGPLKGCDTPYKQTHTGLLQSFGFTVSDVIEINVCAILSLGVVHIAKMCVFLPNNTKKCVSLILANEILSQSTRSIDIAVTHFYASEWVSSQAREKWANDLIMTGLLISPLSFLSYHNNKTISAYTSL